MKDFRIGKTLMVAIGMPFAVLVVPLVVTLCVVTPAHAQRAKACICYCGVTLNPPCSEDACKRACGWQPPRSRSEGGPGRGPGGAFPMPDIGGAIQGIMQQLQYKTAFDLNEKGNAALANGDYELAVQYYRQAVQYNPNDPVIRQNLQVAETKLEEVLAGQREEERSASKMRTDINRLKAKLDSLGASAIDFDGTTAPAATSSGGLDFMTAAPPPKIQGGPVQKDSAPPSSSPVDSSVADLRFMGDKPLMVDPAKVAGGQAKPSSSQSQQQLTGLTKVPLFTDEEIQHLFKTIQEESKWPGPKNYTDPPLINPLRDPERARAMREASKALLENKMKAKAGQDVLQKVETDEKLNKARDRILREEAKAEVAVLNHAFVDMGKDLKGIADKTGVKDIFELYRRAQQDPDLDAEINSVHRRASEKIHQGMQQVREKSYEDMLAEIEKAKKGSEGK